VWMPVTNFEPVEVCTAAVSHVCKVVGLRSHNEMVGADASDVVATVPNNQTVRDRAVDGSESESVGQVAPLPDAEDPIRQGAIGALRSVSLPSPAVIAGG